MFELILYVSGLSQVFHDDEMTCLIRLCTVQLLCSVIIELMVSAASDETAHCGELPHRSL